MFAFQPRQRRGRRAKHTTLPLLIHQIKLLAKLETIIPHLTQIRPMDQQTRERHKRRIRMVLPVPQLLIVKTFIVLRARMSQSIVVWMIRLNQNSSWPITSTRATRNLRDELKRSFRRSEIRQCEARINRNHANQSHIRKVVTLGEHLRSHECIDAARAEVSK